MEFFVYPHGSPTGFNGNPRFSLVWPVRCGPVWFGDPQSCPQFGLFWSGLGGFQKIRSSLSRSDWTFRNKWPAPICLHRVCFIYIYNMYIYIYIQGANAIPPTPFLYA